MRLSSKVWFITGTSRGFGRVWAEAALSRGDKVAATARDSGSIVDLKERFGDAVLPLALDVTDADHVRRAVGEAHEHFGRLDVVVNNAGYPLIATIEEASDEDIRAMFDTNVFGAQRVVRAVLPFLREQKSGHIIGVSSGVGVYTLPLIGLYCASKWAFEAMHESLAAEVNGFGIKVTILEPGAYATGFGGESSRKTSPSIDAYDDLRKKMFEGMASQQRGNPHATAEAVLKIVDAESPPLRFAVGSGLLASARAAFASRIAEWEAWEGISNAAQG